MKLTIVLGKNYSVLMLKNTSSLAQHQSSEKTNLFIIDWELAQFGRKEYDIGQMIGDLYERKHFKNADNALWLMQGFVHGYGISNEDSAFRIAIHAGVHLICWYIRRDPGIVAPSSFTEPEGQKVQDAIRMGTDFVVKGWARDRSWFIEKSELKCLFEKGGESKV